MFWFNHNNLLTLKNTKNIKKRKFQTPKSQMASSSVQDSFKTGASSSELSVVRIIPTTRKQKIWSKLDLCEISNGLQMARCEGCSAFLTAQSNSTLKSHLKKHCNSLKNGMDQGQSSAGGLEFQR